jgi:hypothetical protein
MGILPRTRLNLSVVILLALNLKEPGLNTFTCTLFLLGSITLQAQDDDSLYFQFEPDSLHLTIGDSANVKVTLFSKDG